MKSLTDNYGAFGGYLNINFALHDHLLDVEKALITETVSLHNLEYGINYIELIIGPGTMRIAECSVSIKRLAEKLRELTEDGLANNFNTLYDVQKCIGTYLSGGHGSGALGAVNAAQQEGKNTGLSKVNKIFNSVKRKIHLFIHGFNIVKILIFCNIIVDN